MKYIIKNEIKSNISKISVDSKGMCFISYYNNYKQYPCHSHDIQEIIDEEEINLNEYFIKINNRYEEFIKSAIKYTTNETSYYYIQLNNEKKLYHNSLIELCQNAVIEAKQIFNYVNNIIDFMKCNEDKYDNDIVKSLFNNFNLIKMVTPNVVLYNYLIKETIESYNEIDYIFPFHTNSSQIDAVKNVFKNKISVIDGPPGCGKTQTILNVIANAVYNDKSVAVVSSNNSAVENILEKLKKSNLDFLCAKLGSVENEKNFLSNQPVYPEFLTNYKPVKNLYLLQKDIDKCIKIFDLNNSLSKLKMKLEESTKEYNNFIFENNISCKIKKNRISIEKITDKINKLNKSKRINKNINKLIRGTLFIHCRNKIVLNLNTYNEVLCFYKVLFYERIIYDLNEDILRISSVLNENKEFNYEDILYNESRNILNLKLKNKYNISNEIKERKIFDYKFNHSIINEYPVVLSTTHSINNAIKNYKYDYVIVDESSQVNIINGILAMSVAKNIVFVGDLKQLDSVVSNKKEIEEIGDKYKIDDSYKLHDNNILKSIINILPDVKRTLLKEHYRCHPKIIDFCNKTYYNNELIIYTENTDEDVFKVILTPEGNHCRENSNQRELDVILNEIEIDKYDVGVIAPYNNQIQLIRSKLNVEVDTIHKFQGREKDCIIFTTVDNVITDFVDNPNLINVAVSRAINQFILITNPSVFNKETNIKKIVDYVTYNNIQVEYSKVHSIFDLLYKCCEDRKKQYLLNNTLNSLFDSEKIFDVLLNDVLSNNFSHYGYCFQYPLLDVIRDINLLTDELLKYAFNKNTKIDFLIYNKLNKKPILAIEVNGTSFHKKFSKQYYRDIKKTKILELSDIPLLVLSTDGSNEKEVLIKKLNSI